MKDLIHDGHPNDDRRLHPFASRSERNMNILFYAKHGFTTNVPQRQINKLLGQVIGRRLTVFERLKMKLAYSLPNAVRLHRIYLKKLPI